MSQNGQETTQESCNKCYQIFKVCLTTPEHYTLKVSFKKVKHWIKPKFSMRTFHIQYGQLLPSQLLICVLNRLNESDVLISPDNRLHSCEHSQFTVSIPYRIVFLLTNSLWFRRLQGFFLMVKKLFRIGEDKPSIDLLTSIRSGRKL